jgi:hypothetical protein
LRRKRSYFIFWRTRPPEMLISSQRTTTCSNRQQDVPGESPMRCLATALQQLQPRSHAVAVAGGYCCCCRCRCCRHPRGPSEA